MSVHGVTPPGHVCLFRQTHYRGERRCFAAGSSFDFCPRDVCRPWNHRAQSIEFGLGVSLMEIYLEGQFTDPRPPLRASRPVLRGIYQGMTSFRIAPSTLTTPTPAIVLPTSAPVSQSPSLTPTQVNQSTRAPVTPRPQTPPGSTGSSLPMPSSTPSVPGPTQLPPLPTPPAPTVPGTPPPLETERPSIDADKIVLPRVDEKEDEGGIVRETVQDGGSQTIIAIICPFLFVLVAIVLGYGFNTKDNKTPNNNQLQEAVIVHPGKSYTSSTCWTVADSHDLELEMVPDVPMLESPILYSFRFSEESLTFSLPQIDPKLDVTP